VGRRYTKEEIKQIKALAEEGLTNQDIAERIGRPEAGIRNLRHRIQLKTSMRETVRSLRQDIRQLRRTKADLAQEIKILNRRHQDITVALQQDELTLHRRLWTTLTRMKYEKPELFHITTEEQIGKLVAELAGPFLKWILS
jgi:DNA-binding CsgD family transcriptional regulator